MEEVTGTTHTPAKNPKEPAAMPASNPQQSKPAGSRPRTVAPSARFRRRHLSLLLFFLLWVVVPVGSVGWYLFFVADDQYASHVGFSVRKEEMGSAIELLGGITELSGSSSSDTDILYEFIQSQQMVRIINKKLDLRRIYHNPGDPYFSIGEDGRIEALSNYWQRMVKVFYDSGSGLIEVRVLAFKAEDAHAISQAVFEESSRMINDLSAIARSDATRYAEEELVRWQDRLRLATQIKVEFQNQHQLVDPEADIQGQMSLLSSLNAQLSAAIIELEILIDNSFEQDPRVQQSRKTISVIEKLIEEEREKLSGATGTGASYSQLLAEFEALQMNLEFARQGYLSAQATYDLSQAEAQRQSRYLVTHITPTLAETPEYPRRAILLAMVAGFLLLSWAILVMVYYSLRDRS